MSKVLGVIKSLLGVAIGFGSGAIVSGIASDATKDCSKITNACAAITTLCISGLVADKATEYMEKQMDEMAAKLEKLDKDEE